MKIKTSTGIIATAFLAIFSFGCSSATTNTTSNKPANAPNSTSTSTTSSSTVTTAPANTDTANADSTGAITSVQECNEYITKFEACLTTISAKSPKSLAGFKGSFEAERDLLRESAATPEGKAALAAQCKAAITNAKNATAAWCTNW